MSINSYGFMAILLTSNIWDLQIHVNQTSRKPLSLLVERVLRRVDVHAIACSPLVLAHQVDWLVPSARARVGEAIVKRPRMAVGVHPAVAGPAPSQLAIREAHGRALPRAAMRLDMDPAHGCRAVQRAVASRMERVQHAHAVDEFEAVVPDDLARICTRSARARRGRATRMRRAHGAW